MADTKSRVVLEATDKTKAAFDSVQGNLTRLSGTAGTLNGTLARLAPLIGAATFTAFIKQSIDAADSLNDMSNRTGVAVETLAGLQLVADQSDTSLEALGKGINKLSIFMAENSERAKELGLTAKEPEEAYVQLAKTLSNITDISTRNSIANEVLGKSYQEQLPALIQGNEALAEQISRGKELNPITTEMAQNAAIFNDRLDELKLSSKGLGVELANDLLPSLVDITGAMSEAAKEGNGLYAAWIGLGGLGDLIFNGSQINQTKEQIKELEEQVATSKARLLALPGDSILEFIYGTEETEQKLEKQLAKLEQLKAALNSLENPRAKDRPAAAGGDDPDVKSSGGKSPQETIQETIDLIRQENSLVEQGVSLEDARTIAKQKQLGISDELIVRLLNEQGIARELAEEEKKRIDAKKQLLEDEKIFMEGDLRAIETEMELENEQLEIEEKMLKQQEDAQASYDKTLEGIAKEIEAKEFLLSLEGLSKKVREEMIDARNVEIALQETLNALAEEGLGLSAEEIEALRAKYAELAKLGRQVDTTKTKTNELGLTFKSALEDAIVDGKDLGDILKGLEQDIMRILTRKLVTEPLEKAADEIFSGIDFGDIFGSIFGSANGNAFDQRGVVPFAKGGIVNGATPFMFANGGRLGVMGEAGPEAILPLRRGSNGQLGVQSDGNGGTSVTVNIIGATQQPKVEQRDDGNGNTSIDVIFDAVTAAMIKDIRSEGMLAQTMQNQYGLNRSAGAR
jgi:hypothetical protein